MESYKRKKLKERKREKKRMKIVVMYISLVLVCITLSFLCYRRIRLQLYHEHATQLTEISNQMVKTVDVIAFAQWRYSAGVASRIQRTELVNQQELYQFLEVSEEDLEIESIRMLAFDDEGNYYASDGRAEKWELPEIMASEEERNVYVTDLSGIGLEDEQLLFLIRLKNPVSLEEEGITLTHIGMVRGVRSFQKGLSITGYHDSSDVCLVYPDGTKIYQRQKEGTEMNSDNVLEDLKGAKFIYGNYKTLKKNIKEQKSGGVKVSINGNTYLISHVLLEEKGWMMMICVPVEAISINNDRFMRAVVWSVSVIAIILVILSAVTVYTSLDAKNSRRRMIQQEEINRAFQNVAAAENANRAKSDFLSHMSHDVRTPINGIIGMVDIANKNMDSKERVQDCLNKIAISSNYLLLLINDVLDMSKIETGKMEITKEPFELNMLLDNCVSIICGQLTGSEVLFEQNYDSLKNTRLFGDELHLRQILLNILSNAVKFTPDGGKITFEVKEIEEKEDKVTFQFLIEDTGRGMSREFQEHMFEPFTQENDNSRSSYQGTGLGMAIVKKLVDQMEGRIQVYSRLNEGTRFTIILEFATCDSEKITELVETPADENIDLSGMRVMLVEDNELNAEIAVYLMEEIGIEVVTALNGKEAVDLFAGQEPGYFDVILMDIMMPVMNGLIATQEIRAMERPDAKEIPIFAMTANAYAEDVKKTMEVGMDEHLSKPIDTPSLMQLLMKYKK